MLRVLEGPGRMQGFGGTERNPTILRPSPARVASAGIV